MTIRLTPATADAGPTRVFQVLGVEFDSTICEFNGNGEIAEPGDLVAARGYRLTLICRDGKICLSVIGPWQLEIKKSMLASMSVDEVERIHTGRSLVMVN